MSDTVIIYYSIHHQNTRKVLDAVKAECNVALVNIESTKTLDLSKYKTVAFASGIYFAKICEQLSEFVADNKKELMNKDTFIITTAGSSGKKGVKRFTNELIRAGMRCIGAFQCYGHDTYGIFKYIGGIHKNHPNESDCNAAVDFCKNMIERKKII